MLETLVMMFSLLALSPAKYESGLATTFKPMERLNNGILACDHGRRWTDPGEMLIASRSLPCGTVVIVTYAVTGKSAIGLVLDVGPYGGVMPDGEWVIKRPGDASTAAAIWRGVADLSPGISEALGFPGLGHVMVSVIPCGTPGTMLVVDHGRPARPRMPATAWTLDCRRPRYRTAPRPQS